MIKFMVKCLLLMLAFLPFQNSMQAGVFDDVLFKRNPVNTPPMIRVLVVNERPGAVIEVKGKYRLYDPKDQSHISTRFIGKRKYIQALKGGLQWSEEFPSLHQLMIVPDEQNITVVVDGIEYRGSIYVYDVEGKISVVNEVYIEDYLASQLTPQVRASYPEEVFAAIAITARTNAYFQVENPKNNYWDVDGKSVKYQGYAVTDGRSPIEQAIEATRYLIMSRSAPDSPKAQPFQAQWDFLRPTGSAILDSAISLQDAETMAKKGDHAAKILERAFPGTSMLLMHYSQGKA